MIDIEKIANEAHKITYNPYTLKEDPEIYVIHKTFYKQGFCEGYKEAYMWLRNLYKQWCKETKRNGTILIGGSIQEFFDWLNKE